MSSTYIRQRPVQYELDLRPWQWVQLELGLDLPSQPKDTSNLFIVPNESLAENVASVIGSLKTSSNLHVRLGDPDDPVQSRIDVIPDLVIETPAKRPNALVRFFHKRLLGITWESV